MVTSLERKIKKTACENKAVVQTYGEYIRGTGSLCSSLLGLNSFRYNLLVYFSNSKIKTDFKKHFLELEIAKTLFIIEVSISCSSFIIRKYNFFFYKSQ